MMKIKYLLFIIPSFLLIFCPMLLLGQILEEKEAASHFDTLFSKVVDFYYDDDDSAWQASIEAEEFLMQHMGKETEAYARLCHMKGSIQYTLRDLKASEYWHLEAVQTFGEVLNRKDHRLYPKSLSQVALINSIKSKFDVAVPYYLEAIEIWEEQGTLEDTDYLGARNNLAMTYSYLGKLDEAEAILLKSIPIYEKKYGKNHPRYPYPLSSLALTYLDAGNYEKSEVLFLEIKALHEKNDRVNTKNYCNVATNLGLVYLYSGKYEKAEALFLKSIEIFEKELKDTLNSSYSNAISNLGIVYSEVGNYKKAEALSLKAINLGEKTLGRNHEGFSNYLMTLGNIYFAMEDYEKTLSLYQEGQSIREDVYGKAHAEYAGALLEEGSLHLVTGNYEVAENILLTVKSIFEDSLQNLNSKFYLTSLHNLGDLYQKQGAFELAERELLACKKLATSFYGTLHPNYVDNALSLAKLYQQMNRSEDALSVGLEVNRASQHNIGQGALHLSEAEMQNYLETYKARIDWFASLNFLNSSREIVQETFNNNLFYKSYLLQKSNKLEQMAASAPVEVQDNYLKWKSYQRRLAYEYSKPIAERGQVDEIEQKAIALEKELVRQIAGFEATKQHVDWISVQNQLSEKEAVIEILHFNFQNPNSTDSIFYAALILKKEGDSPQFVPLFEEKQIGSLRASRSLYAFEKRANRTNLKTLIGASIKPYLEDVERIYYSPSGLLHRINFGAIPFDENQIFAERFQIHSLGSSRKIVSSDEREEFATNDAILFGGIQYKADAGIVSSKESIENSEALAGNFRGLDNAFSNWRARDWEYLEWAEKEALEIQNILEGAEATVVLKKGYDASESAFKQIGKENPSPRILHLATHGYFFPDVDTTASSSFRASKHPLIRSGLILANANEAWKGNPPKEGEDGILTAYEIAQMDLSNTELAVLSACDTGLGDIEGNEGVYGLQRAFKMAGVKYLLMSLWKVNDAEAYEFMTTFYKEWQVEGKSIPDAYRAAQSYMRSLQPNNPRSWAGFVLVE